jgi:hypothetical protein
MKNLEPIKFISEKIEIIYNKPPLLEKKPECPDGFIWAGENFQIIENLAEWKDFTRRGRMARNMSLEHRTRAASRGSLGVGRFYFRVKVNGGRIFDLYYDRAVKSADERKGEWFLHQELGEEIP